MKVPDVSANKSLSEVQESRTASVSFERPASEATADQVSLGNVAAAISKSLEPSSDRVAALRKQYLDGTYKVDAAAVSAKIVNEHMKL